MRGVKRRKNRTPDTTAQPLPVLGPPTDRAIAARIRRMVEAARKIVITGHERPDGDCIGSEVALCAILRAAGFDAAVVNSDPPAAKYRFLTASCPTRDGRRHTAPVPVRTVGERAAALNADLVFVLDATTLQRLGRVTPLLADGAARIVNLDHHQGNQVPGDVNWVDSRAAATAELVWRLAACCRWPVPFVALQALYTALVTDTGQFSYFNTSTRVLRMAAGLVERGVNPEAIWQRVYLNKSPGELALDARARASLRSAAGGRIAYIALRRRDFEATGATPQQTEEMATIPRALAGVELSLFFYAIAGGRQTKVSMRSGPRVDVAALARQFGGGGHRQAAACALDMGLQQAIKTFLPVAERYIAQVRPGRTAGCVRSCPRRSSSDP